MDKSLETYKLPKLKQEEIENSYRPKTSKEIKFIIKNLPQNRGAWVKHPTSAQVMISRFMGSSPASDSVLTAQSMKPALYSVFPSLFAPPCSYFISQQ